MEVHSTLHCVYKRPDVLYSVSDEELKNMEVHSKLYCVYKRPDVALLDLAQFCRDIAEHATQQRDRLWEGKLHKIDININKLIHTSQLKDFKQGSSEKMPVLSIACKYAPVEMVEFIISLKADPEVTDSIGDTALHAACRSLKDTCAKIRLLLTNNPSLTRKRNCNGTLPIHIASLQKTPEALKALFGVRDNAQVNASTNLGLTPLHISAHNGNNENVRVLLKRPEIMVNVRTIYGDTPSHHAAYYSHIDVFTHLQLDARTDKSLRNTHDKTAEDDLPVKLKLLYFTKYSTAWKLNLILNVEDPPLDDQQNSVLHLACSSKIEGEEKVQLILQEYPFLFVSRNLDKDSVLHKAAANENSGVLNKILQLSTSMVCRNYTVSVNAPNRKGMRPLHIAVLNQIEPNVNILLKQALIDVNAQNIDGDTPAHLAAHNENDALVSLLKTNSRFNPEIKNKSRKTYTEANPLNKILLYYIKNGSVDTVRKVMERGAKLISDDKGNTALHLACTSGTDVTEKIVLLAQMDKEQIHCHNTQGQCPLHVAVKSSNIQALEALITHGYCDINIRDIRKQTALHHAVTSNLGNIVDYLINYETIKINAQDNQGNTPAHLAGQQRRYGILSKIMWNPNFNVSVQNIWGQAIWTPYGTLTELFGKTWREQTNTNIEYSVYLQHLVLIQGRIYRCHEHGLTIYNQDLEQIGSIATEHVGRIRGVTALENGDLVVASHNGLFVLSAQGDIKRRTSEGKYFSVSKHNNSVYASCRMSTTSAGTTHIEVYDVADSWHKTQHIPLPCSDAHMVTLHVTRAYIYACCLKDDKMYVLSRDGRVLGTEGDGGHSNTNKLHVPWLCHGDGNDAVMVSDYGNNRLQVMEANHHWSVVDTQPQLYLPRTAVYTPGRLYVLSLDKESDQRKLSLYLPYKDRTSLFVLRPQLRNVQISLNMDSDIL